MGLAIVGAVTVVFSSSQSNPRVGSHSHLLVVDSLQVSSSPTGLTIP